jgi:hypothetical protein
MLFRLPTKSRTGVPFLRILNNRYRGFLSDCPVTLVRIQMLWSISERGIYG